jgi:hypothetical protein
MVNVRRLLWLVVMFVVALVLLAPRVVFAAGLFQAGDGTPPPVISPGIPSALAIGALISFLLDNLPFINEWFNGLSSTVQKWIVVVFTTIAGFGIFIATNPPGVLQVMTFLDWSNLAQNIIVAIGASQLWYKGPGKTLAQDSDKGRG